MEVKGNIRCRPLCSSDVDHCVASTDSSHKVAPNTAMEVNHTTIYRSSRTR